MDLKRPLLLAVLLIAVLLRIAAASNDLWLDEIWSLKLATGATSAADVFTGIHQDNNHYLNTLYLWLLGPAPSPITCRALAIVAGTLIVMLPAIYFCDRVHMMTWALLSTPSFLLVLYSSEARGYAPAALFALLSLWAMVKRRDRLFALFAVLGMLSHLTFVFVYAGFAIAGGRESFGRRHAIPIGVAVFLYMKDIRHMRIGGGTETALDFALCLGILVSGVVLLLAQREDIRRERLLRIIGGALAVPLIAFLLHRPDYAHVRYTFVCFPFVLLLLTRVMARSWHRGYAGRLAYVAVAVTYVSGNMYLDAALIRTGRGQYREAVEYIVAHSETRPVTVASDHDFRNRIVLDHHAPNGARIRYVEQGGDAEWMLIHSQQPSFRPMPDMWRNGYVYTLERQFDYAGLSGWRWFVYHRRIPEPSGPEIQRGAFRPAAK
jgi:hypothetical protein